MFSYIILVNIEYKTRLNPDTALGSGCPSHFTESKQVESFWKTLGTYFNDLKKFIFFCLRIDTPRNMSQVIIRDVD